MAKKSKSKFKIILISVIVLVALLISYSVFFKKDDSTIIVTTSKVERKTIVQKVSAVGSIKPETEVKISSETSGELIFLGVQEGDTVSKGQILARVKPDIIETQLKQQEAALDAAKMDIEFQKANVEQTKALFLRTKDLFAKEFASKQDFESAKANYDKAQSQYQSSLARFAQSQASLSQIKRSADRTTITSPINGIVTSLAVELGEKILGTAQFQGTEVMRVADLNVMNAIVEVDENDIVLLTKNDLTKVEIDAFKDIEFNGFVKEIGHSAIVTNTGTQDQTTNFEVKIRLTDYNKRIRPGMSCEVKIETETRENVLSIPLGAVTVRADLSGGIGGNAEHSKKDDKLAKKATPKPVVFVRHNNSVELREVEVGISDNGFIEITSGLKEGEEIVSGSYAAISKELSNSSKIKVENNNDKKAKWNSKKGGK